MLIRKNPFHPRPILPAGERLHKNEKRPPSHMADAFLQMMERL
jgi:hypothetical protein